MRPKFYKLLMNIATAASWASLLYVIYRVIADKVIEAPNTTGI